MSNGEQLKEMTARMIAKVGSRKEVAKRLGVSENDLSMWCNPEQPRFIPVDHLIDLNELAGDMFLRELAPLRDFELVPIKARPHHRETLTRAEGDISKCAGDLVHDALQITGEPCLRQKRELRAREGALLNAVHSFEQALG